MPVEEGAGAEGCILGPKSQEGRTDRFGTARGETAVVASRVVLRGAETRGGGAYRFRSCMELHGLHAQRGEAHGGQTLIFPCGKSGQDDVFAGCCAR